MVATELIGKSIPVLLVIVYTIKSFLANVCLNPSVFSFAEGYLSC